MMIFTPVDLPIIEPDDWETFWKIWNKHSSDLVKIKMNTSTSTAAISTNSVWIGLDIYKKFNVPLCYSAPFYDIRYELPNLYKMISTLGSNVHTIRLVQSTTSFSSHTDDDRDNWHIRAFLYGNESYKQWYFTKPNDVEGKRTYITMPLETNWFSYNDKHCWHGTDYDAINKKILLQVFSFGNIKIDLTSSAKKYKEHVIEF